MSGANGDQARCLPCTARDGGAHSRARRVKRMRIYKPFRHMLAVLASATFPIGTARCAAHSSLKGRRRGKCKYGGARKIAPPYFCLHTIRCFSALIKARRFYSTLYNRLTPRPQCFLRPLMAAAGLPAAHLPLYFYKKHSPSGFGRKGSTFTQSRSFGAKIKAPYKSAPYVRFAVAQ